jgi:hypothetical protein
MTGLRDVALLTMLTNVGKAKRLKLKGERSKEEAERSKLKG